MKKLDRYILQNFLSNFLFSIIVFLIVFILVDLIDRLDKFMDAGMPRIDILRYYLLTVPWFISIAIPMSLLISTVFSLGVLQKRNEITAIKASGISIRRFSISLLFVGIIFSLGSFYFDNNVVTQAMHSRTILEDKYFKSNQKPHIRKKHIHRQISPQEILIIHRYLFKQKTARNISIQKFNNGNIISRLDAPEMKWNDKTELWYIPYYTIRQWTKSDSLIFTSISNDTTLYLNFTPLDLTKESVKPEEMNYEELLEFVTKLEKNGIREPRWAVNLHFKSAFACSSFLMILFGLSLSVRKPRSNIAVGIGVSILTIFLYYAALKFGQSLGYQGIMNPFLSVWGANISFFVIGVYLFFNTRT